MYKVMVLFSFLSAIAMGETLQLPQAPQVAPKPPKVQAPKPPKSEPPTMVNGPLLKLLDKVIDETATPAESTLALGKICDKVLFCGETLASSFAPDAQAEVIARLEAEVARRTETCLRAANEACKKCGPGYAADNGAYTRRSGVRAGLTPEHPEAFATEAAIGSCRR